MTSPQRGREWSQKCWDLLSKKTTKGEEVIIAKRWSDVVYGRPLTTNGLEKIFQRFSSSLSYEYLKKNDT